MIIKAEGKISEIICDNEYFATLIMKKKVRGMIMPVVFSLRGEWRRGCCDTKIYQEGDKVRIWFVPICKKSNNRYFTNLVIEKMEILEKNQNNLFGQNTIESDDGMIDTDTGELIES
jgi:hypothetical protein